MKFSLSGGRRLWGGEKQSDLDARKKRKKRIVLLFLSSTLCLPPVVKEHREQAFKMTCTIVLVA
jgi:hypothetical protein